MDKKKKKRLAVIVLGKQNSGKSKLWYTIFGRTVRTGWKRLPFQKRMVDVYLKNSSFEEMGRDIDDWVFLQNASMEELGEDIGNYMVFQDKPEIVFISVQYTEHGMETIEWLQKNGYYLYIQMLEHGYHHKRLLKDDLGFERKFSKDGQFHKRSGKEAEKRTKEVLDFLIKWIIS